MTIKELKEILKKADDDLEVVFQDSYEGTFRTLKETRSGDLFKQEELKEYCSYEDKDFKKTKCFIIVVE